MYRKILLPILLLGWSLVTLMAHAAGPDELISTGLVNPGHVDKPEWFKASFLDLREDVEEARDSGKRVILYFYQDGCPYCERLIKTNFTQHEIASKAQQNFEIIAINMWGDREVVDLAGNSLTEKRFAVANRVQYTPTLLFLNEKGETIFRANGYYPPERFTALLSYIASRQEQVETFRDYLKKVAPQKSSGKLHQRAGYLTDKLQRKRGDRPLLVLFEQRDCAACDELHGDKFRRLEIVKLLKKFDIALIDIWSTGAVTTPAGESVPVQQWIKALNVNYTPSMLFFDDQGHEVFRAEAYLRSFHTAASLEYVASGAYREHPEFQRYVDERADKIRDAGGEVDLWK
ncbi:MAG: thioredoxin fold domain-containing protein [Gammaproteobacteria bacterium]|nr:thioredoxin fold domain-containing protein [Gammaproteobacteria bacterium]